MNSIDSWDHIIDGECAIWICAYPKLITLHSITSYIDGLSIVCVLYKDYIRLALDKIVMNEDMWIG